MKKHIQLFFLIISLLGFSQPTKKQISEIQKFQKTLNAEYQNPKESPLRGEDFDNFNAHPFFPINLKYRVKANLIKTKNPIPFEIPTSSGKTRTYREYGKAEFVIDGEKYSLTLYQNLTLIQKSEYKNHLFLPFRDATNGNQTYGGGKYMDLEIPKSNEIILDFNQSYQPFCAYNAYDYSCPIVPEENKIPVEIRAGVMYEDKYHH